VDADPGVGGDPITEGLTLKIPVYDSFTLSGDARPILVDDTGAAVALRTDGGTYRVVYLGFDPTQAKEQEAVKTLILNAIRWLAREERSGGWDVGIEPIL